MHLDTLLDDFDREALYTRPGWFVHAVQAIDPVGRRVVAELDTTLIGALVDAQRAIPGHDRHVPAVIAIQMTGTLGQLYAVYVKGLRVTAGWVGFGTHIHKARFARMGVIGPPVTGVATCTRERRIQGTWFLDFEFVLSQGGQPIYTSHQTAAWRQP